MEGRMDTGKGQRGGRMDSGKRQRGGKMEGRTDRHRRGMNGRKEGMEGQEDNRDRGQCHHHHSHRGAMRLHGHQQPPMATTLTKEPLLPACGTQDRQPGHGCHQDGCHHHGSRHSSAGRCRPWTAATAGGLVAAAPTAATSSPSSAPTHGSDVPALVACGAVSPEGVTVPR